VTLLDLRVTVLLLMGAPCRFLAGPCAGLITSQGRDILPSTVDLVQDMGVPGLEVRPDRLLGCGEGHEGHECLVLVVGFGGAEVTNTSVVVAG